MEDETIQKLMEEHKDDFATDDTSPNDQGNSDGGDNGEDQPSDAPTGADDSSEDGTPQPTSEEAEEEPEQPESDEDQSTESDDSEQRGTEQLGEKKDANSRIRQLIEERKAAEAELEEARKRLAEKEDAEYKAKELEDDPVYTVDDFIGTLDDNGDPLTDSEAKARFAAWEAGYKLRQYQRETLKKEAQNTLLALQRETADAFSKFPEFDRNSEEYDPDLGELANEMFAVGLIYEPGHEGDNRYIIGSKVEPGKLLERLHNKYVKEHPVVTKVNNLGDDTGPVVSSKQVDKKETKYAPGFRGEVDKQIDNLMKGKQ